MKKYISIYEPLHIELSNDGNSFKLLRGFGYELTESSFESAKEIIYVPKDFVSTASNLCGFRIRDYGYGLKLSILHEYLCKLDNEKTNFSRQEADSIVFEAMKNSGEFSIISTYTNYALLKFFTLFFKVRGWCW